MKSISYIKSIIYAENPWPNSTEAQQTFPKLVMFVESLTQTTNTLLACSYYTHVEMTLASVKIMLFLPWDMLTTMLTLFFILSVGYLHLVRWCRGEFYFANIILWPEYMTNKVYRVPYGEHLFSHLFLKVAAVLSASVSLLSCSAVLSIHSVHQCFTPFIF